MKTGSRSGSRAGSPTRLEKSASRGELVEGAVVSLKKVECSASRSASRRSSATSETAEFANVSLKKSKKVKGEQSKFEVEQVSLKPIPVGEGEETAVSSSSSAGVRNEGRASSVTRQRVLRDTKFEANDEEYHDIKSSLDKLKKKEAAAAGVTATPNAGAAEAKKKAPKDASPSEDAAAKPMVFRRPKKLPLGEEETEKVHLKPVNPEKRMSFTSSIECVKKAVEDEEKEKMNERPPLLRKASFTSSLDNIAIGGEEREKVHLSCFSKEMGSNVDLVQVCQDQDEKKEDKKSERAPLLRKASYTSSLDNIAIGGEEHEKVHLSCYSKEMGSNVDLVQVCQDHGEGKHEVKLEFEIEGSAVKENKEQEAVEDKLAASAAEVDGETAERLEEVETAVERRLSWLAAVDSNVDDKSPEEPVEEVIEEVLSATVAAVNGGAGMRLGDEEEEEQQQEDESEEEEEEHEEFIEEVTTKLHKIRKAPSIDGLFQRQDVQAAFTFTLPFQNEQPTTKLSLELPSLS